MNLYTVVAFRGDLKDPKDTQGRTFREVNKAKQHLLKVGQLVDIDESGVRLFIKKLTRDCDGTPLYSVGFKSLLLNGYSEESLTLVYYK